MGKKVKTAAAVAVPKDRGECNILIEQIGAHQRERERLQTEMNAELAKLKTYYEQRAKPHADRIAELMQSVQIWAEANRAELTQDGKVKTVKLAAGEVRWRLTPPAVTVRGAEAVIKALKLHRLARFIRIKEEVDKEAILREPKAVEGIAGISIGQREEFVVEPFATELEEVA